MILGVTMGDAAGVGPEIVLRSYQNGDVAQDFVLIGDYCAMILAQDRLGFTVPLRKISSPDEYVSGYLNMLDMGLLEAGQIRIGQVDRRFGQAARAYVVLATQLALRGEIAGLVTLPMNKEATRLSDPDFSGHTELIAKLSGSSHYAMMIYGRKLVTTYVSTHVSMARSIALVSKSRILDVIRLTQEAMKIQMEKPRIAVAGLNAHAGENGSFGDEDLLEIRPAVLEAQAEGIEATGPIAPDSVFLKALGGQYDAVVCMYHDQGHIPQKLLEFEDAINITLGLCIIRTSVDHGTAFDIAYQGKASTTSYVRAFRIAEKIAQSRYP